MNSWIYSQSTKIIFETGAMKRIAEILDENRLKNGVLVADPFFAKSGLADRIVENAQGKLIAVFSEVEPNPTVFNVNACADLLRDVEAEFVLALGGGSSMDCAKAAATLCTLPAGANIRTYHGTGVALPETHLPLICVPTTAGTGSEVTGVAVLSDPELGKKAPIGCPNFYASYALIDPELTISVPAKVTAATGLDVLCHAIEGYWSTGHQPICDACAVHALHLVFDYLPRVVADGTDIEAREKMCEASVIAGLAFNLPKTTSSHACSFPLTTMFHIPHGEACALTIDYFARVNKDAQGGRVQTLAHYLGFRDVDEMADRIAEMKREFGLRTDLKDFRMDDETFEKLIAASHHPNMLNNPVEITDEILRDLYGKMR